jgi:hypothetical protein
MTGSCGLFLQGSFLSFRSVSTKESYRDRSSTYPERHKRADPHLYQTRSKGSLSASLFSPNNTVSGSSEHDVSPSMYLQTTFSTSWFVPTASLSSDLLSGLDFGCLALYFEYLYHPLAPQCARQAMFSRSFRISDAVGFVFEMVLSRLKTPKWAPELI